MRCFSPAKINLFLEVGEAFPDGYHRVETLLAPLELADEMKLSSSQKFSYRYDWEDEALRADLPWETNLLRKALEALESYCSKSFSFELSLLKRIPTEAGLGGGSGNAATLMVALNEFFSLGLSRKELVSLGQGLGADVAYFVEQGWQWAKGRGEVLSPVKAPFGDHGAILLKPWGFKGGTAMMYRLLDELVESRGRNGDRGVREQTLCFSGWDEVFEWLDNDFGRLYQEVSLQKYLAPSLVADEYTRILEPLLSSRWGPTVLCGSGSCWLIFNDDPQVFDEVQRYYQESSWIGLTKVKGS